MKQVAAVTPLRYEAPHLTVSINRARLLGRLRRAVPTFRPSRIKAQRLKVRLRGTLPN